MSRVKKALGHSYDVNDRPSWCSAADPEMHQTKPYFCPEERAGGRGEAQHPVDTVSLSSWKSVRACKVHLGRVTKTHKTVPSPGVS